MTDIIESLRHQRDLLGAALCKLLQAQQIIRPDVEVVGPELLMIAESEIERLMINRRVKRGPLRNPEIT
jgi:hypothetical protein